MKHRLESRLPGELSITLDMQMTSPLWQKVNVILQRKKCTKVLAALKNTENSLSTFEGYVEKTEQINLIS